MFLSIYFYFAVIGGTMGSTLPPLDSSCLDFRVTKQQNETNACYVQPYFARLQNQSGGNERPCVHCTIKYVDIVRNDNCLKNVDCAKLDFANNLIFEKFFRTHRDSIANMFPTGDSNTRPVLTIVVKEYNLTNITFQYIAPLLDINAAFLTTFLIWETQSPGLNFPPVVVGEFPLTNYILYMYIDCAGGGGNSITYQMGKDLHVPNVTMNGECLVRQVSVSKRISVSAP